MAAQTRDICPRSDCPEPAEAQLLYLLEPTDETLGLACPTCVRARAKTVVRQTPCDSCGAPRAWRSPGHRKNIYLCGRCHETRAL